MVNETAITDQVVWKEVALTVGGEPRRFERGDLLPEPLDAAELNNRALLRLGGALRVVEVVYTRAELQAMEEAEQELELGPTYPPAGGAEQQSGTGQQGADTGQATPGGPDAGIGSATAPHEPAKPGPAKTGGTGAAKSTGTTAAAKLAAGGPGGTTASKAK